MSSYHDEEPANYGVQPLLTRHDHHHSDDDDDDDQYSSFRSTTSERANSEARAASIVVFGGIMAYSFVVCLENVIVFPSLWPNLLQYCGEDYDEASLQTYLGWTMGAFSLGRGLSALVINGRAPTRTNMRVAATVCFLLSAAGCAMYVVAWSPPMLVLSRALSGLGAGALTLMITALSSLSSPETRTSAISQFFVAAALGEIAGPLISYATVSVNFQLNLFGYIIAINEYNCVGLWTLGLFMFSFVFVCRSIDASAQPEEGRVERLSLKLFQPRLIMIFTLALFVNMGVSSWETVVTPLAQQHFRWGVESNSIIFILSGAILFFSNIVLVRIATKLKVSDETGTVVSIMVATLGAVLLLIGGNDIAYFVLGNLLFTLGKVYFLELPTFFCCWDCWDMAGVALYSFFVCFLLLLVLHRYLLSSDVCHINVHQEYCRTALFVHRCFSCQFCWNTRCWKFIGRLFFVFFWPCQ